MWLIARKFHGTTSFRKSPVTIPHKKWVNVAAKSPKAVLEFENWQPTWRVVAWTRRVAIVLEQYRVIS